MKSVFLNRGSPTKRPVVIFSGETGVTGWGSTAEARIRALNLVCVSPLVTVFHQDRAACFTQISARSVCTVPTAVGDGSVRS